MSFLCEQNERQRIIPSFDYHFECRMCSQIVTSLGFGMKNKFYSNE